MVVVGPAVVVVVGLAVVGKAVVGRAVVGGTVVDGTTAVVVLAAAPVEVVGERPVVERERAAPQAEAKAPMAPRPASLRRCLRLRPRPCTSTRPD